MKALIRLHHCSKRRKVFKGTSGQVPKPGIKPMILGSQSKCTTTSLKRLDQLHWSSVMHPLYIYTYLHIYWPLYYITLNTSVTAHQINIFFSFFVFIFFQENSLDISSKLSPMYYSCSLNDRKKNNLGPVVQSIVSLTSLLRVISLTVLADSMHKILIFFAEKMWVAKLLTFFQQKISEYLRITRCKF